MHTEAQPDTAQDASHVKVRVEPDASLMPPAETVIQDQASELERWAAASAARGIVRVHEQLARLRAQGAIDEQGGF